MHIQLMNSEMYFYFTFIVTLQLFWLSDVRQKKF